MGHSRGKEPNVACVEIVNVGLPCLINESYTGAAVEYVRPFSRLMPMKFTICFRRKSHIYPSHLRGGWEVVRILLTSPTCAVEAQAIVAKTHGPLCLGDTSCISAWRGKYIAVETIVAARVFMLLGKRELMSLETYQGQDPLLHSIHSYHEWAEAFPQY